MGRRFRHKKRQKASSSAQNCCAILDSQYINLCRWMKRHGFDIHKYNMKPVIFADTGRGLQARRAINKGDCLVSVPEHLLITTHTAQSSYMGNILRRSAEKFSATEVLCLFLLCEKSRGAASFWQPYIRVLPEIYTNAAYWRTAQVHALPDLAQTQALKHIATFNKSFDRAGKLFELIVNAYPEFRGIFSLDEYRWAWSTLRTRSVYMKQPKSNCLDEEDNNCALAPFLDLLNHSAEAQVEAVFNVKNHCYELRTLTRIAKYKQVLINYGPHENARLLVDYGFLLPHNPHECVQFSTDDFHSLEKSGCVDDLKQKLRHIYSNNLQTGLYCNMEGLSWKLAKAIGILVSDNMDECAIKQLLLCEEMSQEKEILARSLARTLLSRAQRHLNLPYQGLTKLTPTEHMICGIWKYQQNILDQCIRDLT